MEPSTMQTNGATLLPNGMVKVRRTTMPAGELMREKVKKHRDALKARRATGHSLAGDVARVQAGRTGGDAENSAVGDSANGERRASSAAGAGGVPATAGEAAQDALFGPGEKKRQHTREKILQKHMQKLACLPGPAGETNK